MNLTPWTKAALLITLPLGAAWYLWHGHGIVAAALMAAAFVCVIGSNIRACREIRRKQQDLQERAKRDGRYVAEHIDGFGRPQTPPAAELPAESLAHFEDLLAQITRGLSKR
jgi:hypothetical protein